MKSAYEVLINNVFPAISEMVLALRTDTSYEIGANQHAKSNMDAAFDLEFPYIKNAVNDYMEAAHLQHKNLTSNTIQCLNIGKSYQYTAERLLETISDKLEG